MQTAFQLIMLFLGFLLMFFIFDAAKGGDYFYAGFPLGCAAVLWFGSIAWMIGDNPTTGTIHLQSGWVASEESATKLIAALKKDRDMEGYFQYNLDEVAERYGTQEHSLFAILKEFGESDDYWIAGGAVRQFMQNLPITTDVDFFFRTQDAFDAFIEKYGPQDSDAFLATTEHHKTFLKQVGEGKYKIQAIKISYYATPSDCLDSFDFTICQLAVHNGRMIVGRYSLWDLARKRLALHKLTYGAASVRRLLKYSSQGFTACSGCIVSLLRAVGDNPDVINSDIQYVD